MKQNKPEKDERSVAVGNASYTLGYKVVLFAILIDVGYRSLILRQSSWDLLGIAILGGLVASAYQLRYRACTQRWTRTALMTIVVALAVAAAIVLVKTLSR